MADAEREIRIVISGKNLTGPEFEKARQALAGVSKESTSGAAQGKKLEQQWQAMGGALKQVNTVAGVFGVTLGATAVVGFAGKVFTAAERIKDMAQRLGVSYDAAQRFKYAADQTGATVDDVEKAIATMNRTLAVGDRSTVAALQAAGLNIRDLRAMKPEDAFREIADAVGRIPDPMTRANTAQELFGTSSVRLLPGMIEGFEKLGRAATVMSDDAVEALEQAKQNWENFGNSIFITTGNWLGALSKGNASFRKHVDEIFEGIMKMSAAERDAAKLANADSAAWQAAFERLHAARRKDINLQKEQGQTTTELSEAQKKAAAEAKQRAEEAEREAEKFTALRDKLFGRDAIDQAKAMVEVVGSFPSAWALTDAAQQQVLATLQAALAAYARLGIEAPDSIRRLAGELQFLSKVQAGGNVGLQAFAATLTSATLAAPAAPSLSGVGAGGNAGLQAWLASRASTSLGAAPGVNPLQTLFGMSPSQFGAQLSGTLLQAVTGGGNVGQAAGSFVGQAMGTKIAGDLAKKTSGFFTSGLGQVVSAAVPGLGALLGPLAGKLTGWVVGMFTGGEGGKANDLRDQLKAKFGDAAGAGLAEAVSRFQGLAGVQEAYDRFMRGGSREQVQRAFDDLTGQIDQAEAVMRKYGLSVDDLKSPQDRLASSTKNVSKELDILKGMGFTAAQASKAMAKELNDLVRASLETGTKLPGTLAPYLDELLRGGLLADDLAAKMLGVPEKAKAPWQEMQAIAEEFGLDVERFGTAFQQSRLGDTAEDFARKFMLLYDNVDDVGYILDELGPRAQTFLDNARKWGLELPPSMRPVLESLLEQGRLVDENGQKMTSLEGVKFGKTVAESMEPLTDALWGLIDVFDRSLPASLQRLRDDAGRGVDIPVRFDPQNPPDPGSSDRDGDGVSDLEDRFPDDPSGYANGGVARNKQRAWVAERGPEIIGGEDFMGRVMDRVMDRLTWKMASGAGQLSTTAGQTMQITVPIRIGDQALEPIVLRVTADALAQGRLQVPERVVRAQVSRG